MSRFYSIIFCCVLFLWTGCSQNREDDGIGEEALWVNLDLKVLQSDVMSAPGRSSREVTEPGAGDNEKMHTLRIILVRPEHGNEVEENRLITFVSPLGYGYGRERIKVQGNEKKLIYLLVNEKSSFQVQSNVASPVVTPDLKTWLSTLKKGDMFPVEEFKELTLCMETMQADGEDILKGWPVEPLPMSECYEIGVGAEDKEVDLFVIRAAVKFSFYVSNESLYPKNCGGVSIYDMASQEYYLPRILKEMEGGTFRYAEKTGSVSGITYYDYATPATAQSASYHYKWNTPIALQRGVKEMFVAQCYLLEEGNHAEMPKSEGDGQSGNITESTGKYEVSIWIDGAELRGVLPALPQLPRNTHVKVYVTIKDTVIDWEVDVRPYTEVTLDPDFGL